MTSVYGYNTPGNMRVFDKRPPPAPKLAGKGSVLEYLKCNSDTTLFMHMVVLAGLEWLLEGPMFDSTVFVPLDSELTKQYGKAVFVNMTADTAYQVVKYSILKNRIEYWLLSTLNYSEIVPHNSHDRITLTNIDGNITLNGNVHVRKMDVVCANGVILFTDNLLVPVRR